MAGFIDWEAADAPDPDVKSSAATIPDPPEDENKEMPAPDINEREVVWNGYKTLINKAALTTLKDLAQEIKWSGGKSGYSIEDFFKILMKDQWFETRLEDTREDVLKKSNFKDLIDPNELNLLLQIKNRPDKFFPKLKMELESFAKGGNLQSSFFLQPLLSYFKVLGLDFAIWSRWTGMGGGTRKGFRDNIEALLGNYVLKGTSPKDYSERFLKFAKGRGESGKEVPYLKPEDVERFKALTRLRENKRKIKVKIT
tara:strand:- start:289 stop:1053 length:765 start_codon:yes stop_codon:yes gene_type:complete